MSPRFLFYATTILGIGHYRRVVNIVRELEARAPGCRITILYDALYGDQPWAAFHQSERRAVKLSWMLKYAPPAAGPVDWAGYSARVMDQGSYAEVHRERLETIRQALDGQRHDVAVLEYYPFGMGHRRQEVDFLLSQIQEQSPETPVVCSTREISGNSTQKLDAPDVRRFVESFIERSIAAVHVHGDPSVFTLGDYYGDTSKFAEKIRYTGFVARRLERSSSCPAGPPRIVCSVGGGQDGAWVMDQFLEAWSLLVANGALSDEAEAFLFPGQLMPGGALQQVRDKHAKAFASHRYRISLKPPDQYVRIVADCHASVSMCGYNTCYELLRAGVPSVFVPRAVKGIREQVIRAEKLRDRGWAWMASSAPEIAEAIQEAVNHPGGLPPPLDFSGAATTAKNLLSLAH